MKPSEIQIGTYFQAQGKKLLLVKWVFRNPSTGKPEHVGLVRCDAQQMPQLIPISRVTEQVTRGELIKVEGCANKAVAGIRCAEELSDERAKAFNDSVLERLQLINPILNLGIRVFNRMERSKAIARVCSRRIGGRRHSRAWVGRLLWLYWAGGALALGDRSYNCGSVSRKDLILQEKEATYTRKKRQGRPIKMREDGDVSEKGGCLINAFAEGLMKGLTQEYFDEDDHRKEIQDSLERYHALPWKKVWQYVVGELDRFPDYRHLNPSRGQVKFIAKRWVILREEIRAALGPRHVDLNYSPRTGDSADVSICAGTLYQIDPALADIFVTDEVTGMVLGRPNLIYIVDGYSGMIVGIYFTLDDINYGHVARALHCAFSSKPDWCAPLGYVLPPGGWPVKGRCGQVDADNADMRTLAARVIPEMVADLGLCRPYRGTDKAYVETTVQLANIGAVHIMNYGVTKGPKERAKDDPSDQARVSFGTFIRAMLKWVVEVGNHRPIPMTRKLDPDFMAWARENKREHTVFALHEWNTSVFGGPPAPYTSDWFPRLLERKDATITSFGLEVDGVYFDDPKSAHMKQLKLNATVGQVQHTPVHFDRLTTSHVYFVPKDVALPPVAVPRSRHSDENQDLSFMEVEHRHEHRGGKHKTSDRAHAKRSGSYRKSVHEDVAKDEKSIKKTHGSIANRNRASGGVDTENLRKKRIEDDNARMGAALHPAPQDDPEHSSPPAPASRPALYD